jgi:hypothetical protein
MKNVLFILILLLPSRLLLAPYDNVIDSRNEINIEYNQLVKNSLTSPYEALWQAICFVESSNRSWVINALEQAYGIVQIRQIRLDDYYKRTGVKYELTEMFDTVKSKEVFMYYASMYDNHETIAKRWNGSGPMTIKYWKKVNAQLNKISM